MVVVTMEFGKTWNFAVVNTVGGEKERKRARAGEGGWFALHTDILVGC